MNMSRRSASERPLCVVFVDGLSVESYENSARRPAKLSCTGIVPGAAYSSNLHYLLFQGRTPDELGFFADAGFDGAFHPPRHRLGRVRAACDSIPALNAVIRYARRLILHRNDNTPFAEASLFRRQGAYLFEGKERECEVFGRAAMKSYVPGDWKATFDAAESLLASGAETVVAVIDSVDHIGHADGPRSASYAETVDDVLSAADRLLTRFADAYPQALCVLLSDHGMSPCRASVDVMSHLHAEFGLPGTDYAYYCDATYLRIWARSGELRGALAAHMMDLPGIQLVSEPQRIALGFASRRHGELIYNLSEGLTFLPNCFGVVLRRPARGLHGYLQPTPSSSGVLALSEHSLPDYVPAAKVHDIVSGLLGDRDRTGLS